MTGKAKGRWATGLAAFGLAGAVAVAIAVASWAAATDSATVDEPSHLVAGYAALERGDHRLSPDHPPLARMLLALPLLAGETRFLPEGGASAEPVLRPSLQSAAAWRSGDFFQLGRDFFETWNDGQRLVRRSRGVAIVLLALLLFTLWRLAGRLLGEGGAAVALLAAAFDPNLLAHGHLATIDVPFTLVALLTLVSFDAWLRRPGACRLALAAAALAAAVLVKFSFFALLPALAAMALAARFGSEPRPAWRKLALAGGVVAAGAFLAIWAAYHFRFAAASGGDAGVATMHVVGDYGRPLPNTPEAAWESVLHDPATGADRPGFSVPLLRVLHSAKLLPEAYLYGAAYVAKKGMVRASYLRGEYSMKGFPDYFAWAFAIKTPLATLALAALGALALLFGFRRRPKVPPLVWGFAVFALVYLAALHSSALNLGVRHLLPVMPLVWLLAGAAWPQRARDEFPNDLQSSTLDESAHLPQPSPRHNVPARPGPSPQSLGSENASTHLSSPLGHDCPNRHPREGGDPVLIRIGGGEGDWAPAFAGETIGAVACFPSTSVDRKSHPEKVRRVAVTALLAWLAIGTIVAAPRLIGYFNESVGGWRKGHLYLADSNLDWGQDLLRLEERLRREPPGVPSWLALASDPPLPRGLAELSPRWLLGDGHRPDPAPVAGGLYAVGATELLGVYRPLARAASWRDPRLLAQFAQLAEEESLLRRGAGAAGGELLPFEALRRLKLISRLAQRPPDERVGASLFLFRLSDREVAEATAP